MARSGRGTDQVANGPIPGAKFSGGMVTAPASGGIHCYYLTSRIIICLKMTVLITHSIEATCWTISYTESSDKKSIRRKAARNIPASVLLNSAQGRGISSGSAEEQTAQVGDICAHDCTQFWIGRAASWEALSGLFRTRHESGSEPCTQQAVPCCSDHTWGSLMLH